MEDSNTKNGKYLDSLSADKKSKILKNIASHYRISLAEAEDEVRDDDAEMLYEYIANDNSLRMQVYNDMEKGKMAKGGNIKDLAEDDFVWNAVGKKLIVDKVTKDEYFLVGFGQPSASPFSKAKVNNYIKTGQWTLKPKMAKGGVTEHGLRKGDTIIDDMFWANEAVVKDAKGVKHKVDLDKGKRYAKGGNIEFRKLAKSNGFDIIVEEGRFEISVDANGNPKTITNWNAKNPVNISAKNSPIVTKYKSEIMNYIGSDKMAKGGNMSDYTKTMGLVKVKFANPKYNYSTNVSGNINEAEARKYFVGKMFDVGSYPKENMQKVTDIEFFAKGTYDESMAKGGAIYKGDKVRIADSNKTMVVTDISKGKKGYVEFSGDKGTYLKGDLEKFAKGGFVGKGEMVWNKITDSQKMDFLYKNFTPEITPRSQELLKGRAWNFLPKNVKIKFEAKYANMEDYAKGGKLKPKMVRTQFEEEEFEYAKGGNMDFSSLTLKYHFPKFKRRPEHTTFLKVDTSKIVKVGGRAEKGYELLFKDGAKSNYVITERELMELTSGKEIESSGAKVSVSDKYAKGGKLKPKMVRTQFEEEEFEYGDGGMVNNYCYSIGGL